MLARVDFVQHRIAGRLLCFARSAEESISRVFARFSAR